MDIGVGILLAVLTADHFVLPLSWLLVAFGICAALFPDLDTLTRFLPEKNIVRRIVGEHRGLLHRPALYLVLVPILFLSSIPVGTLFALGVFYHLVHDTFFTGWGIKWLWPFSQVSISIFHDKAGTFVPKILIWQPHEEAAIKTEYRTDHWVRTFYFRPSLISLTEYPVFLIALVALYLRLS